MCGSSVLVLTRWLLVWVCASCACVMALLGGHLSPAWLLGQPKSITAPTVKHLDIQDKLSAWDIDEVMVRPSLGLWLRCGVMGSKNALFLHCGVYATVVPDVPSAQIAAMVLIVCGTALAVFACVLSFFTTCFRAMKGKSLINLIGALQALAGILCLLGLLLLPLSWNSRRVQNLCGPTASEFNLANCTPGWAMFSLLGGSVGLLLCTLLSFKADLSTTTDIIDDQIRRGKNVIFLL
ncbi:unnamed protein product [Meganyctiphanes norvegica]|uniref:Lipoma HMGIC fusion partner-like 2 protein n=1 Tax=Meganyctiphanes norvegica TaxID=48144 RepID=A0AAV2PZ13_MEGNR